jgi:hypothetical protein
MAVVELLQIVRGAVAGGGSQRAAAQAIADEGDQAIGLGVRGFGLRARDLPLELRDIAG